MTTLAAIVKRIYSGPGNYNDVPIIASDTIYEGAAVGDNGSGYARPLVSGDPCLGFATKTVDNETGSAGDLNVRVWNEIEVQLPVTSVAITDVGRPVYASDDNTFALAGIGTRIGYVKRFVSSGVAVVKITDEPEKVTQLSFQFDLASIADGDILTGLVMNNHGRILDMDFIVNVPATTAAKLTTLNAEIGTTNLTGGTIALTSANCTPIGAVIPAAAITGAAAFKKGENISIEASSTTAFVEGSGTLLITIGQ